MKKFLIVICIILIIIGVIYGFNYGKVSIITYHDFVDGDSTNNMQISKKEFEKEMKFLHDFHYKTLKLKDIECFMDGKCKLPVKSVLITMDDGFKNELLIALPILKKYKLNAVIFYLGENYDGGNDNFMDKDDLDIIKKNYPNIEIASHSYSLHYDTAYLSSSENIITDIDKMKGIVNSKYYAYPYGKYSKNYINSLKKSGYSLGFGFGPDSNHRKLTKDDNRYILPRLNMSGGMPLWKFILRLNWYK